MNVCLLMAAVLGMSSPVVAPQGYPFIVYRQTGTPLGQPEFFAGSLGVHAKYPGAIDDFWMGGGRPLCRLESVRERLERLRALRPAIEKAGVSFSCQQGLTLGHGYCYRGTPGGIAPAGVYPAEMVEEFPEDAWRVGTDGRRLAYDRLCPRSPAVLDYAYRYAKAAIGQLRPVTYWLDDDLRLGVTERGGCFCERCLGAFNREHGTSYSRADLVKTLFESPSNEVARTWWIDFNGESLVGYAKQVRRAADEVMPACRLSLQTVRSDTLLNGRDYGPVLRALSGNGRVPAGIRPGDGYYFESQGLAEMLKKNFFVLREAERCRNLEPGVCGTVCYEEETYPRFVLHKSPAAIVLEAALAIAAGCDSLSLYFGDGERPLRLPDYERFVRTVAESRPYLERLAASTRRTRQGGLASYVGSRVTERPGFTLGSGVELQYAQIGIPVTVAEAQVANKVWFFPDVQTSTLAPGELEKAKRAPWIDLPVWRDVPSWIEKPDWMGGLPTQAQRTALLDALDRATDGRFPVRIDLAHRIRVYARVDAQGRTDSVTLFNLSVGETGDFALRVRNPASGKPVVLAPRQPAQNAKSAFDAAQDELTVTLNLPASGLISVFLR